MVGGVFHDGQIVEFCLNVCRIEKVATNSDKVATNPSIIATNDQQLARTAQYS